MCGTDRWVINAQELAAAVVRGKRCRCHNDWSAVGDGERTIPDQRGNCSVLLAAVLHWSVGWDNSQAQSVSSFLTIARPKAQIIDATRAAAIANSSRVRCYCGLWGQGHSKFSLLCRPVHYNYVVMFTVSEIIAVVCRSYPTWHWMTSNNVVNVDVIKQYSDVICMTSGNSNSSVRYVCNIVQVLAILCFAII